MSIVTISTKRRRTTPCDGIRLRDLPVETLAHASCFLARPSRALFAVAVGGSRSHRGSWGASNDTPIDAILGKGQWEVLDFGEIEDSLASKLTDGAVQDVLVCIDASANLRRLKLTGCLNITGAGLGPLCGSAVLEQLDLSLVAEHESPVLDPEPPISCERVLPILDSIIGRDNNSIKHLHFPKHWRVDKENATFNEFLERCNEMYEEKHVECEECGEMVDWTPKAPASCPWFKIEGGALRGVQSFTCYSCHQYICYDCCDNESRRLITSCASARCEREYCRGCAPKEECDGCLNPSCHLSEKACGGTPYGRQCDVTLRFCGTCLPNRSSEIGECNLCGVDFCEECCGLHTCWNCGGRYCAQCFVSEDDGVFRCDQCA